MKFWKRLKILKNDLFSRKMWFFSVFSLFQNFIFLHTDDPIFNSYPHLAINRHIGPYPRVGPVTGSAARRANVWPIMVRSRWPWWMGHLSQRCWVHIWSGTWSLVVTQTVVTFTLFRTFRKRLITRTRWPWSVELINLWWKDTTGVTIEMLSPYSPLLTIATGVAIRYDLHLTNTLSHLSSK